MPVLHFARRLPASQGAAGPAGPIPTRPARRSPRSGLVSADLRERSFGPAGSGFPWLLSLCGPSDRSRFRIGLT